MLLSLRKNGLASLFKEVRVFKAEVCAHSLFMSTPNDLSGSPAYVGDIQKGMVGRGRDEMTAHNTLRHFTTLYDIS